MVDLLGPGAIGDEVMEAVAFGRRQVGPGQPCLLVAEIGANHGGDPGLALEMVHAAADCGADAVKFQTYTADELVSDAGRVISWGPPGQERREPVGAMFDRLALSRDRLADLFAVARDRGIEAFATPFSVDAARFLAGLDVPAMKIAAADFAHLDLLTEVARSGKPVVFSIGKCTLSDADRAVRHLEGAGCTQLILLHCVSQYPAPTDQMNLHTIPALHAIYPRYPVGLSDHAVGIVPALGAAALGARLIEKHFTLDKAMDGPDHWFSADPEELLALANGIGELDRALGVVRPGVLDCEVEERRNATRSLVLARPLARDQEVTPDDLKIVRPGWGIDPRDRDKVLGMRALSDLPANHVLVWDDFKQS